MGNKQALKDMEMNILVCGEYITFKYTKNLLGYTEIKVDTCTRDGITYAKMTHPSLGWEFLVNENPLELSTVPKCSEFFKTNYLNGVEKNTFIILLETLSSQLCKAIIKEFSEMTKIYHPFLVFVTKDTNPDKKILNECIRENGLRFDKRNVYVHQYNDNNVTDIYFSLLKICSYYNELGDFFNFPVKLNEQDINVFDGDLLMDDNVLMDKPRRISNAIPCIAKNTDMNDAIIITQVSDGVAKANWSLNIDIDFCLG